MVALTALALGGSSIPAERAEGGRLGPDAARSLAAGEQAVETIRLEAGSLVEIVVAQLQGDVAITLEAPDGSLVASSDLPGKPWLEEYLAALITTGGDHRLVVEAVGQSGVGSRYRPHHPAIRPSREDDAVLLDAVAEWRTARQLRDLQKEESTRQAAAGLASAATKLRSVEAPILLGRVLRDLGNAYLELGLVDDAERILLEGLAALAPTGHRALLSEMLNYRADILVNRGNGGEAEPMYRDALALAVAAGDERMEARTWNNLGVLHYQRGELERVVECFLKALELQERVGDLAETATTSLNLGATYRNLGRYSDALELSRRALILAQRLEDRRLESGILSNRGVLFKAVGDLRAAADAYQEALRLAEELGNRESEAAAAFNLGSLFRNLGRPERAEELMTHALEASRAVEAAPIEIRALQALGEVRREERDLATAVELFELARQRGEEIGDRTAVASSLYLLGRAELDGGAAKKAAASLSAALELQVESSDRAAQLGTYRELGRALAAGGRRDEAQRAFETAVGLAQLMGDPHQEASARSRFAELLAGEGELEPARRQVSEALATIEALRSQVVQPEDRAGFLSRNQESFRLLIDILDRLENRFPSQGYLEQAFAVNERAKARSLVELMTEAEADLARDLPAGPRQRRDDLAGLLTATQRRLTQALQKPTIDEDEVSGLRSQIGDLNRRREDLQREIRLSDPRWEALSYPQALQLEEARGLLGPETTLLSFVLGRERSFVFVLSRKTARLEALPGEETLVPLIEELRRHLGAPGRRSQGRVQAAGSRLYDALLRPVEASLVDSRDLVIVPDGALYYVPFEALVPAVAIGERSSYLLHRWAVSYVPSMSTLQALRRRSPRSWEGGLQLIAFADPDLPGGAAGELPSGPALRSPEPSQSWNWRRLAGARREVEAIARLFPPQAGRVYLGREANEQRFKSDGGIAEARFIHLASHALIDNREPALSALLLGSGPELGQDGLLQTHEVFELRLRAQLVVLSGCETALGRAVRGEGLLGLTQAFLYAGADAVSVSLWPVEDDSTAHLMSRFYSEMKAGLAPGEALRRAKLAQLERGAAAHPYYWAPFVLVGSPM